MRHKRKVAAALVALQRLTAKPPPGIARDERVCWYLLMVQAAVLYVCLPRKPRKLVAEVQASVLAGVERELGRQSRKKRRSNVVPFPRSGPGAGKPSA